MYLALAIADAGLSSGSNRAGAYPSQTLTRVRVLDLRAQLRLHRLAWARTLTLRRLPVRLRLAAVLSAYVIFGLGRVL